MTWHLHWRTELGGWHRDALGWEGDAPGCSARQWCFFVRAPAASSVNEGDCNAAAGIRSAKLARLEAVLLVADGPLSARKLVQWATLADSAEARRLVDVLNSSYDAEGSAFRIEQVADGYRMLTRPIFARWLNKLHQRQAELKLSPPALETLTIVAYRQPITRADIEAVRGVQCTEMLKYLMERDLVRIIGEDASLGRPYLYGTTRRFLEMFGLRTLEDLPLAERLRQPCAAPVGEPPDEEPHAAIADRSAVAEVGA